MTSLVVWVSQIDLCDVHSGEHVPFDHLVTLILRDIACLLQTIIVYIDLLTLLCEWLSHDFSASLTSIKSLRSPRGN